MSNSELLAEEAIAFALEGADELERLGNREQSLVRAVPAIVADERQQEHIKLYEGEARRWFRLAKAVRQVADRTQLDELRAGNERLRTALQNAADAMTCHGDDKACYCPNCDNSFYAARDEVRKVLGATSHE